MNPKTVIEFMSFVEPLKNVMRHSTTSGGRLESVAEHCWMLCMLATVCFEAVEVEVDQLRVLKMLIVHDLPEIITDDIPAFDKAEEDAEELHMAEAAALAQLVVNLPDDLKAELTDLFEEFEAGETNEAQFANAIDKAEAFIQHNIADIETWDQDDFDYQTDPDHPMTKLFEFDPFMRELKRQIDHDTMSKIYAARQHDRAKPDMVWQYLNGELGPVSGKFLT